MSRSKRSKDDYANKFLSDYVWTTPDNGMSFGDASGFVQSRVSFPYDQVPGPYDVSYSFDSSLALSHTYSCKGEFGPTLQRIQRGIFDEISSVVPALRFHEVSADSEEQANIVFLLCDSLDLGAAGMAGSPFLNNVSNVYIRNKYLGVELENFLSNHDNSPFSFLRMISGSLKGTLLHETGHALGARHLHTWGTQGNKGLVSGFTRDTTVMSYDMFGGVCTADNIQRFLAWDKSNDFIRTNLGPVDKLTLQYAYGDGTSIKPEQTEDTFSCDYQRIAPSPLPTYLLSFYPQIALGAGVALFGLMVPVVEKKAEYAGYLNLSKMAGKIRRAMESATPLDPYKTDGSVAEAGVNAAKDVPILVGRSLFPLAAIVNDIVHDVGKSYQKDGAKDATVMLLKSAMGRGIFHFSSRIIGFFPIYSLLKISKETQVAIGKERRSQHSDKKPSCADKALNVVMKVAEFGVSLSSGLIEDIRVIRHLPPVVKKAVNGLISGGGYLVSGVFCKVKGFCASRSTAKTNSGNNEVELEEVVVEKPEKAAQIAEPEVLEPIMVSTDTRAKASSKMVLRKDTGAGIYSPEEMEEERRFYLSSTIAEQANKGMNAGIVVRAA